MVVNCGRERLAREDIYGIVVYVYIVAAGRNMNSLMVSVQTERKLRTLVVMIIYLAS